MSQLIPPPPPPPPPPAPPPAPPAPPAPARRGAAATAICEGIRLRTNKTDTSREAAEYAMMSGLATTQAMRVLDCLIESGLHGLADYEIVEQTAVVTASVCAARGALIRDKLVKDSGRRRKNMLTGRNCIIWVATQAAQDPA